MNCGAPPPICQARIGCGMLALCDPDGLPAPRGARMSPAAIERPPDWPATEQRRLARPLMRVAMHLLARFDVQGAENMPAPP